MKTHKNTRQQGKTTNLPKRKKTCRQPKHQQWQWVILGTAMILCTLAFSQQLADISNIVRFTLLALTTLILAIIAPAHKIKLPTGLGPLTFLLFVVIQGVSMIWATNFAEALYDLSKWILVASFILLIYNIAQNDCTHLIITLSRTSAAIVLVSMAVAVWQISRLGDLSINSRYGITSLYTHKGTFSAIMLMMTAFPLMRVRMRLKTNKWVNVFYLALALLVVAMIVFLRSRAALLAIGAIVISTVVMWLFSRWRIGPRWVWTILLSVAATCVVVGGSRWFADRAQQYLSEENGMSADVTAIERQALWDMTFRMVDKHPMKGCGAGNWKVCYPDAGTGGVFSIDVLDFNFVRPHNDYLRILSETGYPSLLLMMTALSALIVGATLRKSRHGTTARIGVAFVCGMMAFALFDFPLDRMETVLWTSLIASVAMASIHSRRTRPDPSAKKAFVTLVRPQGGGLTNMPARTRTYQWTAVKISIVAVTIPIVLLGISRWKSESHNNTIAANIHGKAWHEVERHCQEAATPFYNINSLGMPLAYYEAMALEYQKKEALPAFRRALAASPYCKLVLCDMGRLLYTENHNVDSAIYYLEEAIRISPSFTHAYINLAQVYLNEHRPDEALTTIYRHDLDKKRKQINENIWYYYPAEEVEYYTDKLINSEEKVVKQIVDIATEESAKTK